MTSKITNIGPAITELRKLRGLSQVQLAAATGLSAQSVNYIERGSQSPSPQTVAAIAKALDVPTAYIHCLADTSGDEIVEKFKSVMRKTLTK